MPTNEFIKDVELQYQLNLDSTYRHWKRGWINDEAMRRERLINLDWYHTIYYFLNPAKEVVRDELTSELIDQYNTQEGFPLYSLIYYHDLIIPIYDDNYGQQVFAIINGRIVNGGVYNFTYLNDFCSAADAILEWQEWDKRLAMEN